MQDDRNRRDAKVFSAHAAPQGICDNLINALKLLANQQNDGDIPVPSQDGCTRFVGEKSLQNYDGLFEVYWS